MLFRTILVSLDIRFSTVRTLVSTMPSREHPLVLVLVALLGIPLADGLTMCSCQKLHTLHIGGRRSGSSIVCQPSRLRSVDSPWTEPTISPDEQPESKQDAPAEQGTEDVLVGMIQWYKDYISPLMGPNCRFQPTCSSYAITSLRQHGAAKGLLLTAWRILRCNPVGGKGYDPPQWPPPGFFAGRTW